MRLALLALALTACVTQSRIQRAGARVELGTAYYREGNVEGAIEALREAHRLDPRNWRALNALAVAYIAKGETDLADETFRKALRLNPDEAEILVNVGAFQLKSGKTDEAIASFETALRDLDYRNAALVASNLSLAYLEAGRAEDALGMAREAVRRAPQLCEGWYHMGLAQEARKDDLGALEAYQKQMAACPTEDLGARLRHGCIQIRVGLVEEGEAHLRQVIARAPGTKLADDARACLRGGGT